MRSIVGSAVLPRLVSDSVSMQRTWLDPQSKCPKEDLGILRFSFAL